MSERERMDRGTDLHANSRSMEALINYSLSQRSNSEGEREREGDGGREGDKERTDTNRH